MSVALEGADDATRWRRWWASHLGHRFLREVVVVAILFVGYGRVRVLTRDDGTRALRNAAQVVDLERRWSLFTELTVQRAAMVHEPVIAFLNRYYASVHFSATALFVIWVYVRHPDAYPRVRAAFVVVTAAGLALHVAFPLAPPRMLRGHGFVDTLRVYGPQIYTTDTAASVANQFAAMPSLHFGWAVLVGGGTVLIKRTRWSLVLLAHPILTLVAIVATANHYWMDAFVAFVLVVGAGLAVRFAPIRGVTATVPAGRAPDRRP